MSSPSGSPSSQRTPRRSRANLPVPFVSLRSLPVTIRYLVPLGVVAGLLYAGLRWIMESGPNTQTLVTVVDLQGVPLEQGILEFFANDASPSAPSPPPLLATLELNGPDVLTLTPDQVPGEALVRVRVPGYGIGSAYLESGGALREVRLGPPMSLDGRVVSIGGNPVEGAAIVGLRGGERGVPLVETVTKADGSYRLEGFSSSIPNLMLRVLKEDYAILHETRWVTSDPAPDLELRRSRPVVGSVDGLPSPDVKVRILAYKLPGVETEVREDGTFRLHHLPQGTPVQLLVEGLPPGYTHRGVRVTAGSEDVAIHVTPSARLRGRALFADTDLPAAGAVVYHENGPSGRNVATADENGWFSLTDLPSGEVWIHASATSTEMVPDATGVLERRQVERSGRRTVDVDEGRDLNGIEIRIF